MPLSEIDRNLLERCLERKTKAWEDFVDRYIGLVVRVVDYSVNTRRVRMTSEGRDELCAEVFLSFLKDDFMLLRHFRGRCSLVAYLTVIARRIVEKEVAHIETTRSKTRRSRSAPQTCPDIGRSRAVSPRSCESRKRHNEESEFAM